MYQYTAANSIYILVLLFVKIAKQQNHQNNRFQKNYNSQRQNVCSQNGNKECNVPCKRMKER